MPTKKPRYFEQLRSFLDAGESLDQGPPRLLAELVDLRARVPLLEADVKSAANRGQVLVAEAEKERNAAIEEAKLLRRERDRAREDRDVKGVAAEAAWTRNTALDAQLTEAKQEIRDAAKARRELAEEFDRRLATLSRQVDDAASYGRMVGGLVGLLVGVVVSALIAAAL